MQFRGEIACFCEERKCEKHPKKQTIFFIVWGENLKLRGEIFPPKGPEKKKHCKQYISLIIGTATVVNIESCYNYGLSTL